MTLVNDKWMFVSLCHQSSMPYRWNTSDEKMISSILLPTHHLLVICPTNIWLWFLHRIQSNMYDYSHTYSHLGLVVIDFVVAKDTIPFNEKTFENKSITTIWLRFQRKCFHNWFYYFIFQAYLVNINNLEWNWIWKFQFINNLVCELIQNF